MTKNKPKSDNFRQQNLKAWRPILTPQLVILLFLVVGCIFVPIGIAVIAASNSVIEVDSIDYSEKCCVAYCDDAAKRIDANPCTIDIEIPAVMEPPIYMYYKLTNYYQNHRRYVKSRSDMQLRGLDVAEADLETTCQNRVTTDEAVNGSKIISPCGLIAWSTFNDTFELFAPSGSKVLTQTRGIAWKSDVNVKFKNAESDKEVKTGTNFPPFFHWREQPCDTFPGTAEQKLTCEATGAGWCFRGSGYCAEDEHFIVWMRTAGLPTFRKLYAIIDAPLEPGIYSVTISNGQRYQSGAYDYYYNPSESADYYASLEAGSGEGSGAFSSVLPKNQTTLYPVHTFAGTKSVVLSTSSWIGGKNGFLGGAYLTVGIICIVLAAGFAVKQNFFKR